MRTSTWKLRNGVLFAAAFAVTACSDAGSPLDPENYADQIGIRRTHVPPFPVVGAIFTNSWNAGSCVAVNKNIYTAREDVALQGGPVGGGPGLGDGHYAVKVTEPDGRLLGTSVGSGTDRPINVVGGHFEVCYQLWAVLIKASDGTPGFDQTSNNGGEYKVVLSRTTDFAPSGSKSDNFKVFEDDEVPPPPPPPTALLTVQKFYDADADGVLDPGEALLEGWKVAIDPEFAAPVIGFTTYAEQHDVGDDYEVSEFMPDPQGTWLPTTATSFSFTLGIGGETVTFGNVCLGAGGGHTLGFWSNKNGKNILTSIGGLALLNALPLRNAAGVDQNFGTDYNAYRSWLLSANATNMAYMLSAQLAAMKLNVAAGFVSGDAMVYAPGVPGANGGGFISINELMAAAVTELTSNPVTLDGHAARSVQEAIKDTLDDANNNFNFVQATACGYTF